MPCVFGRRREYWTISMYKPCWQVTHLAWSWGVPTWLGRVGSGTTDPASELDGFVMLAVYIAWSLHDTPGGKYMKQAREHGFSLGGLHWSHCATGIGELMVHTEGSVHRHVVDIGGLDCVDS